VSATFDQHRYQVRFEWGVDGLARLAHAEIVVVVDVLGLSTRTVNALAAGGEPAISDAADAADCDCIVASATAAGSVVLLGCLRNATATAHAVMAEQKRRGDRTSIAIVAAGERTADGAVQFAVEDFLGAGAVIDALTTLGIDHTSPEAAVAAEAFHGLSRATRHLLTSSGAGQALLDADARETVLDAAAVDAETVVPVHVDGRFVAA